MTSAQRAYRARVFAEANRRAMRRRPALAGLSSIVWGTRQRNMGSIVWGTRSGLGTILDMRAPIVSPLNASTAIQMGPISQEPGLQPAPFPGNPDTQPGAWPGLTFTNPLTYPGNEPPPIVVPATTNQGGTGTVVVTPTSGPIPSPGTVAAATAPTSWLDQSLIGGIPNKFLLLGGLGAFFFLGRKGK